MTAALAGLLTPPIACGTPIAHADVRTGGTHGALVALTQRFRDAEDLADSLDEAWVRTPSGTDAKDKAYAALVEAEGVRNRLHDAVFESRPETLADATVLAGYALEKAADISDCDMEFMVRAGRMTVVVEELQNALAGILDVLSQASGVPVDGIGWRDLPSRHAAILARIGSDA